MKSFNDKIKGKVSKFVLFTESNRNKEIKEIKEINKNKFASTQNKRN